MIKEAEDSIVGETFATQEMWDEKNTYRLLRNSSLAYYALLDETEKWIDDEKVVLSAICYSNDAFCLVSDRLRHN